MNKGTINTIIGVLVIFGIIFGYSMLTAPSKEEKAQLKKTQDSLIQVAMDKAKLDSMVALEVKKVQDSAAVVVKVADTSTKVAQTDSAAATQVKTKTGAFSLSPASEGKPITITSDLLKLQLSRRGGFISYMELLKYKTFDQLPLVLFNNDTAFKMNFYGATSTDYSFEPFCEDKRFAGKDNIVITGKDSLVFGMRLYPNANDSVKSSDSYVEFRYVIKGDNYMVGFNINMVNMEQVVASNSNYLYLEWHMNMRKMEKDYKTEHNATTMYYEPKDDAVDYLSETGDDEKSFKIPVKWLSFKQQFFSTTLIAKESFKEAKIQVITAKDSNTTRHLKDAYMEVTAPFDGGKKGSLDMSLYFGPLQYKGLRTYDLNLERQIPLGWSFFLMQWINRFAVIPVFNWLESYNMNYGIIILLLTIMLKIVLFPIAYRTYKSSAKMRVLKPEVEEISKKFPKKEDSMKKQQATMALYKKAGVNPMAGCVPMLLQMPILIALYRFFPASIELRQQSFLWANDLSSYDSIASWNTYVPLLSDFYGNHISLFTLLMTVTTIIYTWLNNQMMGSTQQMPGMKVMMYLMPIMFLGFFNSFASGLSYYYFLANIFTFLQMFLIRWYIDEDKIHAQIQENKKKPVKKSGFQARLESMAKNRGFNTSK
jgi:YidC/Oxa1 family membrane protein insertase